MPTRNIAAVIVFWFSCTPAFAGGVEPPDTPGPWAVGRSTFTIVDASREDRTFSVDVWYPVDAGDVAGAVATEYDLFFTSLDSPLALDSPPVSAQGPRPLVVFSHGSQGIRYQSYFLTEALASHGFIVAAPDHTGNTAFDVVLGTLLPFDQIVRERPLDVSVVITTMLARSDDAGDAFAGRIDPARIGVTGHSFGGYTALAIAAGYLDIPPDPRVRAIVPLAPASGIFTDTDLAAIDLPLLLVSGTEDITTPIDPNTTRPWDLVSSPWRLRADIIDGGHQSFTDICDIAAALEAVGIPPDFIDFILGAVDEGCAPDLIDITEAHALTRLFVTSFMKTFVAEQPGYRQFLNRRYAQSEGLAVDFSQYNTGPLKPAPIR